MKNIFEEYVEQICTTCRADECTKGIVIVLDNSARCVDYEKGEVKGYERPLEITAKHRKPLMGFTQEY